MLCFATGVVQYIFYTVEIPGDNRIFALYILERGKKIVILGFIKYALCLSVLYYLWIFMLFLRNANVGRVPCRLLY